MRDLKLPIIWADLDGVFADFEGGVRDLIGMRSNEADRGTMWSAISGCESFWRNLRVMKDAAVLAEWISPYAPVVLTGVSGDPAACEDDKAGWFLSNLRPWDVIAVRTECKPHFARPGDILIDDREANIEAWEAVGGIGVLHRSPEATIAALKKLGLTGDGCFTGDFLAEVENRRALFKRRGYTAYAVDSASRERLARACPPRFGTIHGDHVTRAFPAGLDVATRARPVMEAVGILRGEGLDVFAVTVDGSLFRPDGQPYHLTWSTRPPAKPADANELLAAALATGGEAALRTLETPLPISGTFELMETLRIERKRRIPAVKAVSRQETEILDGSAVVGRRVEEDRGRNLAVVWYDLDGRPHREDGPAVLVTAKEDGKVLHQQWFVHGDPVEPPACPAP